MAQKKGAQIIRFPVERRRSPVVGKALTGASADGTVKVELTGTSVVGGVQAVAGSAVTNSHGEAWWARVPSITHGASDRRPWMKLGDAAPTAKRHRVISLYMDDGWRLMAAAACGRRAPLTEKFDDAMSGGDCDACRKRGYR